MDKDEADGGPSRTGEAEAFASACLDAVKVTAREMGHRLNNHLAISLGALDMLAECTDLPPDMRELVEIAIAGIEGASADVHLLQTVREFHVKETPAGPALDLERSAGSSASSQ